MRFVPYLVSLFFFVLINNLYGIIPLLQFPTFSRSGYAYGLAALTWLLYNGVGIARHGLGGYIKHQSLPGGVSGPILLLIVPLEFISNILVRPVTLALRLFANMFAGHLLLILFTLGGEYLLLHSGNLAYAPVGVISLIMAVLISFLELLVQVLQAYVFTLLTAMYVSGALAEEH
jgi:F-type H+-transporting ATPase subunit a